MKPVIAIACLIAAAGCGRSDSESRKGAYEKDRTKLAPGVTERRAGDPSTRLADANNTAVNTRDRDGTLPTPADQKSNDTDMANVTAIRKKIMDSELSIDARNVKIVAENGRVTLRGPVRTSAEKETVVRIAREIAGTTNVEDLLDVVAAK